jgi:hypothetical protein
MQLKVCRAKTRKGVRCKSFVSDKDELCYMHKPKHAYTHTCKVCGVGSFGNYCRSCFTQNTSHKVSKMKKGAGVIYG